MVRTIVPSPRGTAYVSCWNAKRTVFVQTALSHLQPGLALTGVSSSAPSVLEYTGRIMLLT